LDRISWENFNESGDLKLQVEKYRETYGCYPESIHVDRIYRTRENRAWCQERGIRMSGPKLGRPPKNISDFEKKQARDDERFRNAIEGKFGQAKRTFSLNLVMTKLPETSETSIAITFLVVNLYARHVDTQRGGRTEILGGFFRDHKVLAGDAVPYFSTTDGSLSATYLQYDWGGGHARGFQAVETQGSTTKELRLARGNRRIGLYRGGQSELARRINPCN
jgi:hypothetical protein